MVNRPISYAVAIMALVQLAMGQPSEAIDVECDTASVWKYTALEMYPSPLCPLEQPKAPYSVEYGAMDTGPSSVDMDWLVSVSEYCFFGLVRDVRYECGVRERISIESLAIIEFAVEEIFWGPQSPTLIIEAIVQRQDCPITYSPRKFTSVEAGDRFLVVGNRESGMPCNFISKWGLFRIENEVLRAADNSRCSLADALHILKGEARSRCITGEVDPD